MKAQIDDAQTKKHISKIDDLLGASPVAESQQWKTKAIWPEMSILEDDCNWDDETQDAEDIHDEEEEGDGIGGEEK
jgi:hypothetical protein